MTDAMIVESISKIQMSVAEKFNDTISMPNGRDKTVALAQIIGILQGELAVVKRELSDRKPKTITLPKFR
jgi:hypothetical protein